MTDSELLARVVERQDQGAFEAIVRRHGPLVLAVGRDILRDPAAVDDVFQATFLVLWRNASSIRERDYLGRWLYGTAQRIALRSKQREIRRRDREWVAGDPSHIARPQLDDDTREDLGLLHDELSRLPVRLRDPIVLCHLEGLTYEDAARRLRCPLGTFKSRLGKGRELLRSRLVRRGVGAGTAIVLLSFSSTRASVARAGFETQAESLVSSVLAGTGLAAAAVHQALAAASTARSTTTPSISRSTTDLADRLLRSVRRTRRRLVPATLAGMTLAAGGLLLSFHGCSDLSAPPAEASARSNTPLSRSDVLRSDPGLDCASCHAIE